MRGVGRPCSGSSLFGVCSTNNPPPPFPMEGGVALRRLSRGVWARHGPRLARPQWPLGRGYGMLDVGCREWGVGNTVFYQNLLKLPSACSALFFKNPPPISALLPPAFIRFPGRGGTLPPRSGVHAIRESEIRLLRINLYLAIPAG